MIYLDNAATTLYKPEPVRRAVYQAMGTMGNSGRGAWGPALEASRVVYSVREKASEFFRRLGRSVCRLYRQCHRGSQYCYRRTGKKRRSCDHHPGRA